jgi:dUTP pyrophosphatase
MVKIKDFCATCNKVLNLKPFHKKRFKGPFCCSKDCRGQLLRSVYRGNSNPNYKYKDGIEKALAYRCKDVERRALKNSIRFDLDPQFLYDLYLKQNGLCHYSGIPMKISTDSFKTKGQADVDVLSVDKVYPNLGYTKGNIVLCCSGVNKLKGSTDPLEVQVFLSAIGLRSFGTCKIKFKKVRENASPPFRAKLGDGGHDLAASFIEDLGDQVKVYTGIAVEPSEGWVLLAMPRSSIVKSGFRLSNSVGLIDNQYRGEIVAIFDKKNPKAVINIGDRIIQLVPMRVPFIELEEVTELSETERGTGGFGSTGQK